MKNPTTKKKKTSLKQTVANRKNSKKGGRPKKLDKDKLDTAIRLAELGLTDRQVAHALQVTPQTIGSYKQDDGFFEPYKEAKEKADQRVEESLYQKCLGYTFPEEKIFMDKWGGIHRVKVLTHRDPDTGAIKYWLSNRQKENWKEPKLIDVNIDNNNTNVAQASINHVSPEELTDEHRARIDRNLRIIQRHGGRSTNLSEARSK